MVSPLSGVIISVENSDLEELDTCIFSILDVIIGLSMHSRVHSRKYDFSYTSECVGRKLTLCAQEYDLEFKI
jgi:hypothetical protein